MRAWTRAEAEAKFGNLAGMPSGDLADLRDDPTTTTDWFARRSRDDPTGMAWRYATPEEIRKVFPINDDDREYLRKSFRLPKELEVIL